MEQERSLFASDAMQLKLEEMKNRRNSLFERLQNDPNQLQLAPEIKIIDDQIAECIAKIRADKRKKKS